MTIEIKDNFPEIERLRISVNDVCNLNCLYCHRDGQLTRRNIRMIPKEREGILIELVEYGIHEAKVAAMEPLLNKDTPNFLKFLKTIGIPRTSLTTNGTHILNQGKKLEDSQVDEISISLDTLDNSTFEYLNQGNSQDLKNTLNGLIYLKNSTIPEINLNMTLTKANLGDLEKMVNFSSEMGFDLRVIPLITLMGQPSSIQPNLDELKKIRGYFNTLQRITPEDGKRKAYIDYRAGDIKVTLIDALCPNCETCGKDYALRLTSDGKLKPCLVSENGEIDILTPYRKCNMEEFYEKVQNAILFKKKGLMKYFIPDSKSFNGGFIPQEN